MGYRRLRAAAYKAKMNRGKVSEAKAPEPPKAPVQEIKEEPKKKPAPAAKPSAPKKPVVKETAPKKPVAKKAAPKKKSSSKKKK